jgi:hypothetical protein
MNNSNASGQRLTDVGWMSVGIGKLAHTMDFAVDFLLEDLIMLCLVLCIS